MKSIKRCLLALCALTFAIGLAGCPEPADMSPETSVSMGQLDS